MDTVTVCNINLHKDAKLEIEEFLERIKSVEQLRTRSSDESFTYFISDKLEYNRLKSLHRSLKSGNLRLFKQENRYHYIFGIEIERELFNWFVTNDFSTIIKQIVCWMAEIYFYNPHQRKVYDKDFYDPLLKRAKKVITKYFAKHFETDIYDDGILYYSDRNYPEIKHSEYREKYREIMIEYSKSKSIKALEEPDLYPYKYEDKWTYGFKFHFEYSFMYARDWEHIVLELGNDALIRAESTIKTLKSWRNIYRNYIDHGYYVYNDNSNEVIVSYKAQNEGHLYVLKNAAFKDDIYKVGKTNVDSYSRAKQLYTTGVPKKFEVVLSYEVEDTIRIERKIHQRLKEFRINPAREFFKLPIEKLKAIIEIELDESE